jgi:hypothetical protein
MSLSAGLIIASEDQHSLGDEQRFKDLVNRVRARKDND